MIYKKSELITAVKEILGDSVSTVLMRQLAMPEVLERCAVHAYLSGKPEGHSDTIIKTAMWELKQTGKLDYRDEEAL